MLNPGVSLGGQGGLVNRDFDGPFFLSPKEAVNFEAVEGNAEGLGEKELRGTDLDLYINRNNSNIEDQYEDCSRLYLKLLDEEKEWIRTILMPCNLWRCPICKKRKLLKLRKELREALGGAVDDLQKKGGSMMFGVKLLTLTVPGKEYRAKNTVLEAHLDIKKKWNNLRTLLKKRIGTFDYIAMVEAQRDGYPHLHVVLVGPAIVKPKILGIVREAWSNRYGMGNIDLQLGKGMGVEAMVGYLTKYVTKNILIMPDGMRMYSMSKGMQRFKKEREQVKKKKYRVIEMGTWRYDHVRGGKIFKPFEGRDYGVNEILELSEKNILNELMDWFEDKARGKLEQMKII